MLVTIISGPYKGLRAFYKPTNYKKEESEFMYYEGGKTKVKFTIKNFKVSKNEVLFSSDNTKATYLGFPNSASSFKQEGDYVVFDLIEGEIITGRNLVQVKKGSDAYFLKTPVEFYSRFIDQNGPIKRISNGVFNGLPFKVEDDSHLREGRISVKFENNFIFVSEQELQNTGIIPTNFLVVKIKDVIEPISVRLEQMHNYISIFSDQIQEIPIDFTTLSLNNEGQNDDQKEEQSYQDEGQDDEQKEEDDDTDNIITEDMITEEVERIYSDMNENDIDLENDDQYEKRLMLEENMEKTRDSDYDPKMNEILNRNTEPDFEDEQEYKMSFVQAGHTVIESKNTKINADINSKLSSILQKVSLSNPNSKNEIASIIQQSKVVARPIIESIVQLYSSNPSEKIKPEMMQKLISNVKLPDLIVGNYYINRLEYKQKQSEKVLFKLKMLIGQVAKKFEDKEFFDAEINIPPSLFLAVCVISEQDSAFYNQAKKQYKNYVNLLDQTVEKIKKYKSSANILDVDNNQSNYQIEYIPVNKALDKRPYQPPITKKYKYIDLNQSLGMTVDIDEEVQKDMEYELIIQKENVENKIRELAFNGKDKKIIRQFIKEKGIDIENEKMQSVKKLLVMIDSSIIDYKNSFQSLFESKPEVLKDLQVMFDIGRGKEFIIKELESKGIVFEKDSIEYKKLDRYIEDNVNTESFKINPQDMLYMFTEILIDNYIPAIDSSFHIEHFLSIFQKKYKIYISLDNISNVFRNLTVFNVNGFFVEGLQVKNMLSDTPKEYEDQILQIRKEKAHMSLKDMFFLPKEVKIFDEFVSKRIAKSDFDKQNFEQKLSQLKDKSKYNIGKLMNEYVKPIKENTITFPFITLNQFYQVFSSYARQMNISMNKETLATLIEIENAYGGYQIVDDIIVGYHFKDDDGNLIENINSFSFSSQQKRNENMKIIEEGIKNIFREFKYKILNLESNILPTIEEEDRPLLNEFFRMAGIVQYCSSDHAMILLNYKENDIASILSEAYNPRDAPIEGFETLISQIVKEGVKTATSAIKLTNYIKEIEDKITLPAIVKEQFLDRLENFIYAFQQLSKSRDEASKYVQSTKNERTYYIPPLFYKKNVSLTVKKEYFNKIERFLKQKEEEGIINLFTPSAKQTNLPDKLKALLSKSTSWDYIIKNNIKKINKNKTLDFDYNYIVRYYNIKRDIADEILNFCTINIFTKILISEKPIPEFEYSTDLIINIYESIKKIPYNNGNLLDSLSAAKKVDVFYFINATIRGFYFLESKFLGLSIKNQIKYYVYVFKILSQDESDDEKNQRLQNHYGKRKRKENVMYQEVDEKEFRFDSFLKRLSIHFPIIDLKYIEELVFHMKYNNKFFEYAEWEDFLMTKNDIQSLKETKKRVLNNYEIVYVIIKEIINDIKVEHLSYYVKHENIIQSLLIKLKTENLEESEKQQIFQQIYVNILKLSSSVIPLEIEKDKGQLYILYDIIKRLKEAKNSVIIPDINSQDEDLVVKKISHYYAIMTEMNIMQEFLIQNVFFSTYAEEEIEEQWPRYYIAYKVMKETYWERKIRGKITTYNLVSGIEKDVKTMKFILYFMELDDMDLLSDDILEFIKYKKEKLVVLSPSSSSKRKYLDTSDLLKM